MQHLFQLIWSNPVNCLEGRVTSLQYIKAAEEHKTHTEKLVEKQCSLYCVSLVCFTTT